MGVQLRKYGLVERHSDFDALSCDVRVLRQQRKDDRPPERSDSVDGVVRLILVADISQRPSLVELSVARSVNGTKLNRS